MTETFSRRIRTVLKAATFLYLAALAVVFILLAVVGERHWLPALWLYLPQQGWLLPLAVLTPLCLLFCRKWCWWHLAAVLWVLAVHMDFRWSSSETPSGDALSVLTSNIGQRKTRTLWPFMKSEQFDILALQEAWRHERAMSRENPGYFASGMGEFVLVSRYEIKNSGFVPELWGKSGPAGAWFEVDYQGTPIVVYNIHLPTPRPDFERLRGAGFLAELSRGGGIYSKEVRQRFQQSMDERAELLRKLRERLDKEDRPFFVLGDFNIPSGGYLHGLLADKYTDAFAEKGCGYGWTFPGQTRNPLSLFGPWLRIDYIFSSVDWQTLDCVVEPRQPAQHRAVAAKFVLRKPSGSPE